MRLLLAIACISLGIYAANRTVDAFQQAAAQAAASIEEFQHANP